MFTEAQRLKLEAILKPTEESNLDESRGLRPVEKAVVKYEYDHPKHGKHTILWNPSGWSVINKAQKVLGGKIYPAMRPSTSPKAAKVLQKPVDKMIDDFYK